MRTVTQTYFEQLAAAPQRPALGGEPDILGKVVSFGEGPKEISWAKGKIPEFGVELIDRAHLAPLQAEIERLDDELDERGQWDTAQLKVIHGLNDDVARLKARCNEMESGLRIIATAGTKTRAPDLRLKAKQTLIRALSKPAGSEQV
ncbi:hypothetical protein [Pseudomonas viridiflava]|nr:hypothetical protein [Pseudomonas viridiflava]